MALPIFEIPELNSELDSGRYKDYTPPNSLHLAYDSVLASPHDQDICHTPNWEHHVDHEKYAFEERLETSLGQMSSAPAEREPFSILGWYMGLQSPGVHHQFGQASLMVSPGFETHQAFRSPQSPQILFHDDTPSAPPVPEKSPLISEKMLGREQSNTPLQRRATPVKLNAPHARDFRPKARNSSLTFFVLWDPDTKGMTMFSNSPTVSNDPKTPRKRGPTLPQHPKIRLQGQSSPSPLPAAPHAHRREAPMVHASRSTTAFLGSSTSTPPKKPYPSQHSTSGGGQLTAQHPFDPLKVMPRLKATARTMLRDFPSGNKKANRNFSIVDDEGFFESPELGNQPEEFDRPYLASQDIDIREPHLPCRFSTSTSASNQKTLDYPPGQNARKLVRNTLKRRTTTKKKANTMGTLVISNPILNYRDTRPRSLRFKPRRRPTCIFSVCTATKASEKHPNISSSAYGDKLRPTRKQNVLRKLKRGSTWM